MVIFRQRTFSVLCLICCLICFWLNGSKAATENSPRPQQFVARFSFVPMMIGKTVTGQALIRVQLSKTLIGTFSVDTGSATSVISTSLVRKLGLVTEPAVSDGKPYMIDGKQATMATVPVLKLGGINFPSQPFVVKNDNFLAMLSGSSFDGIIGINILHRMATQWNFKNHSLTFFYPGQLNPIDLRQLNFINPNILPITEDTKGNGLWYASVRMTNGFISMDQRLMIDTGANMTTIPNSVEQHLGLKPYGQNLSRTFRGSSILDVANVETLQVGDLTLPEFPVSIRAASSKNEVYLLGLDVLSNYRVLMDFPARKMYLQPSVSLVPAITIGPAPATTTPPAK